MLTVGSGQCLQTGSLEEHGPVINASHLGFALHAAQQLVVLAFGMGSEMIPALIASMPAVTSQVPHAGPIESERVEADAASGEGISVECLRKAWPKTAYGKLFRRVLGQRI